ncbi:hypothetical protein N7478_000225 [Penicillium angulare]|uniref:uncharacterized protein n=1 Tax=Penicillium angulare TaxID=116970 RepID=UPI0025424111|nr:uncharacterized protein N7478_000225 [Penicillium angulare]KAJ5290974.1 hypothetical protein N7478_000225 [Penicillium angulare]
MCLGQKVRPSDWTGGEKLKGVIWGGRVISAGHPCIVHPPCFPEVLHTVSDVYFRNYFGNAQNHGMSGGSPTGRTTKMNTVCIHQVESKQQQKITVATSGKKEGMIGEE